MLESQGRQQVDGLLAAPSMVAVHDDVLLLPGEDLGVPFEQFPQRDQVRSGQGGDGMLVSFANIEQMRCRIVSDASVEFLGGDPVQGLRSEARWRSASMAAAQPRPAAVTACR